ncbi:MAG: flavodoxin domain-containing protein [Bacteroidota bacterium]
MNGIVIYKSRYGAAKQYAEWIAETLNIPAKTTDEVTNAHLIACDYVIAGSSIYIGKILMKDWLMQNSEALTGKKHFLFIVGAAPPSEKAKTEKYFTDNISNEILKSSQCYYLQGKSIFKELSWWDKFLLKAGAKFAPTPELKKEMLTEFNAIRKENLNELLNTVEVFRKPK